MSRGRCGGMCRQAFTLGSAPEVLAERFRKHYPGDETEFILDMLIPLGRFNRNPIASVKGDPDVPVQRQDEKDRHQGWFYTCKHHDPVSLKCKVYEDRPFMCRAFPNYDVCPFEGCDYDDRDEVVLNMLEKLGALDSPTEEDVQEAIECVKEGLGEDKTLPVKAYLALDRYRPVTLCEDTAVFEAVERVVSASP